MPRHAVLEGYCRYAEEEDKHARAERRLAILASDSQSIDQWVADALQQMTHFVARALLLSSLRHRRR